MIAKYSKWEVFLPTPSHGGRRGKFRMAALRADISTHALTWRATDLTKMLEEKAVDFYPRPHMEGDLTIFCPRHQYNYFYPRPHMEGDALSLDV